jgi:hypothetical protein
MLTAGYPKALIPFHVPNNITVISNVIDYIYKVIVI